MSSKWLLWGSLAIALRASLFAVGFDFTFSSMVELTTPTTSFKRLKEALHLIDLGMSPYESSTFIQPPLVLVPFSFPKLVLENTFIAEYLLPRILFIVLDVIIAFLLHGIGHYAFHLSLLDNMGATARQWQKNLATFLPIFYLLNPVMIASCVSMSTVIFNNLGLAIMLYFAMKNNIIMSTFGLALSIYLTVYPIVLVIPLVILLHQVVASQKVQIGVIVRVLVWTFAWQALLQYMSYSLMSHSWEFVQQAYLYPLAATDLTPNWGNFWYFFIEVFDHFRMFFLIMFNVHMLSYIVPLCIRFKRDGLFIMSIMVAICLLFKAYPTFGDFFFYITILMMYAPLAPHMRYAFPIVVLMLFTMLVGPAMFNAWIVKGTGNANFFYFVTLAFLLSQVLLIVEFVYAKLKHIYVNK